MAAPRRRLTAGDRRELVVAAGARLFAEHGYDGARLELIAAEAGVTKPVLYRHFDSKKDLYLALLRRHGDDMPGFVAELPADAELEPLVEASLDRWLSYAADNPHGWRMIFRDTGGDSEVEAYRREVNERARRVIADFLRRAPAIAIPPSQLEPTAEILSSGLAGMVLWWQEHPEVRRELLVAAAGRLVAGLAERR